MTDRAAACAPAVAGQNTDSSHVAAGPAPAEVTCIAAEAALLHEASTKDACIEVPPVAA
jgi:hypothetical protein